MNPLTTEDIVSLINICVTLSEEEKQLLVLRVLDDLETHENRLSPVLAKELDTILNIEQAYLSSSHLPILQKLQDEAEDTYQAELDRIRPHLDRMVEEYHQDTEELTHEYDKAFRQIDLETDQFLQKHTKSHEESQIEAIKAKLSKSSSGSSPANP